MSRYLVVGYTWLEGVAHLRLRADPDGKPSDALVEWPLEGRVCFHVHDGMRCVGFFAEDALMPCPDRARAVAQCPPCQGRDRFRACLICDGFRCPRLGPAQSARCHALHHLYLACFGDDTVKVGTASHRRRTQRIVEQGPLAAVRVASAEGPIIKQMESLLVSAGFAETMRRSRKMALLRGVMSEREARGRVLDAAEELVQLLPARYHPHLHRPEVIPQPPLALASRGLEVEQVRVQPGTVIEGEVVGAIGHVLFVGDPDGRFALDLGELKSRVIEFDPSGPRRRPIVQLGLF